jgi:hypothetical protein
VLDEGLDQICVAAASPRFTGLADSPDTFDAIVYDQRLHGTV